MTYAPAAHPRTFPLLWTGQFVTVAGLTVIVPLMPFYFAGFGLDDAQVALWTGLALTAPAATQALTGPLWGWLGDRCGRKAMVVRAQLGLAVAVGLMTLATSPGEFLVFRLLQGAFGGVVSANAAFASSLAAPGRQGRAMGGLFGATGAGSLVGPLLGSLVASRLGFSALFAAVAALMFVVTCCSVAVLREPGAARQGRRDRPWSLSAAARTLTSNGSSRRLILAGFIAQAGVYALLVVFAPRVAQITGAPEQATVWVGLLQAVTWAASLAGALWWGRRNDRFPPSWNFALAAAGCAIAGGLQGVPADPELLVPLRLVQGFCFAALAQSVLCLVGRLAPEAGKGSCLGLASTVIESGQIVGPLVGWLIAVVLPAPTAFAVIGALFVAAGGLTAFRGGSTGQPVRLDLPEQVERQVVFHTSRAGDRG